MYSHTVDAPNRPANLPEHDPLLVKSLDLIRKAEPASDRLAGLLREHAASDARLDIEDGDFDQYFAFEAVFSPESGFDFDLDDIREAIWSVADELAESRVGHETDRDLKYIEAKLDGEPRIQCDRGGGVKVVFLLDVYGQLAD